MSSRKKNKKAVDFHGFFIQKRTDKNGRQYYIDTEGKQRSKFDYSLQWSKEGRVSKETFEKTLAQAKKFDIDDTEEARLIAYDYEIIRKAPKMRKREIELLESQTKQTTTVFQATDAIKDAEKAGAIIKILTPTGQYFRTYKGPQAMETTLRFIRSVSSTLADVKKGDKGIKSPLLQFNFEHEITPEGEPDVFYFDFKNLSGMEDFKFMNQLIKDNFDT